jgi:hypothetical protein
MTDELTCEVCNEPATHTFSGVWTGSVAGALPYCRDHVTALVVDVLEQADGGESGVLLHFTVGALG